MRLPNNYGSVFKLSGKRRKPFAVRIMIGKNKKGSPQYKYIGYFEKKGDALSFLAKYNDGLVSASNAEISSISFKNVFDEWITEHERYKSVSQKTHESYTTAFNQLKELHDRKFVSININDLQRQIDRFEGMSRSTISKPITLLHFMYKYAMKMEYVDKDLADFIIRVSPEEREQMHKAFRHDEIQALWDDYSETAKQLLLFIYTGFRATELLDMKISDVHLKDRYMVGGKKTAAGKNRAVPIHKKILPIVKEFYNENNEYLITEDNKHITYNHFKDYHIIPFLNEKGMKHTMHDTRHTCASLLKEYGCDDLYRKLILGHHIQDLTDRVYTHVEIQRLILEMDKIQI